MKVKIQHEYDHEPTYLVADNDTEVEVVTLHTSIPVPARKRIAKKLKKILLEEA